MSTKKNVLVFSVIAIIVALLATEELRFCNFIGLKECPISFNDSVESLFFPFFFVFFFSLLTYFMKDEVFRSWWNFAKWAAPTIAVVSFILNGSGGGGFGIPDLGGVIVLVPLYILFISISLVRIWAVSHEEKNGRKVSAFVSIFLTILIAATILFVLWQVAASL